MERERDCGVLGPGSGRCGGCAQYIGGLHARKREKRNAARGLLLRDLFFERTARPTTQSANNTPKTFCFLESDSF